MCLFGDSAPLIATADALCTRPRTRRIITHVGFVETQEEPESMAENLTPRCPNADERAPPLSTLGLSKKESRPRRPTFVDLPW